MSRKLSIVWTDPLLEGFMSGVDDGRPALAGGGGDEAQVGLFVGTIQTDDQVIRMRWVHGLMLGYVFLSPAGLTRRRQYRRVVM